MSLESQVIEMISTVKNCFCLAILNRCIPLWVGARGIEFDWKYIQMSFDSNISLVRYVVTLCFSFCVRLHHYLFFFFFFSL